MGFKKGALWYNNGEQEHQYQIEDQIPSGWVKGRLPRKDPEWALKSVASRMNRSPEQKRESSLKKSESLKLNHSKKTPEEKALIAAKRKVTMDGKSEEEIADWKKNMSEGGKGKNKGNIPWNKGLTKEDDERILRVSEIRKEASKEWVEQKGKDYFKNWRSKVRAVMHKNNSFRHSKPEEDFYQKLLKKYSIEDIERNYNKDPRYPFQCDFYIKSEDLFIEINAHPTHGPHPFDPTNEEDLKLLEELKNENSDWSNAIINIWTIKDVKKFKFARENKLNYKAIYIKNKKVKKSRLSSNGFE